jgi:S1-C subfamily serine protease
MKILLAVLLTLYFSTLSYANDVSSYLQDISVTIKSSGGTGSGVLLARKIRDKNDNDITVNFVWTAAHVIENLRNVRTVLDSDGQTKKIVEFKDAEIVKKMIENGSTVGQIVVDAKVIKYSDAKDGQDLALLMIRKLDFSSSSAKFHLDKECKGLGLGTQLYHVGSLLGENGSNSMTTGIMSQVGRMVSLNNSNKILFDQTTVTAFPGSSGGGVFLTDGQYVGMLVRGAGETFNLIVPMRRMTKWAEEENIMWALDDSIKPPSLENIEKLSVENLGKVEK